MLKAIIPIFFASDARASAQWYGRLGFVVEGEQQFEPGFPLYMFLRCGANALHLSEHQGDAQPGSLIYGYVDNLEAIAAEFDAEIIEQPWGNEVHLTDPNGNRLRLSASPT